VIIQCSFVGRYNISEEYTASIFRESFLALVVFLVGNIESGSNLFLHVFHSSSEYLMYPLETGASTRNLYIH
jgi:hypothetical protein